MALLPRVLSAASCRECLRTFKYCQHASWGEMQLSTANARALKLLFTSPRILPSLYEHHRTLIASLRSNNRTYSVAPLSQSARHDFPSQIFSRSFSSSSNCSQSAAGMPKYNPKSDIPNLSGKVILVTGG